jgi:opacity protein-like surface antigen
VKNSSAIYIGLLIFLFGQTIHAEDVHATGWRLTPYAWLPATIDVDSTVAGTTVPIDMDLGDVFDHFDVFAFSMRGEYWWGQWGVVVDGMWTDLDGKGVDLPIPFIDSGKVEIDEGILDVLAAYRFQIFDEGSIRVMAGGRYHYLKQEITLTPIIGSDINLGTSKDWMEVLLGAQYIQPISAHWRATVRADASGFGIGSGSDITTSALAGIGYKISDDWGIDMGYRYYYIDYSADQDTYGLEGDMHGPWLGITYQKQN